MIHGVFMLVVGPCFRDNPGPSWQSMMAQLEYLEQNMFGIKIELGTEAQTGRRLAEEKAGGEHV